MCTYKLYLTSLISHENLNVHVALNLTRSKLVFTIHEVLFLILTS